MWVELGEDGYIYIARNREHLQELKNKNQQTTIQRQTTERVARAGVAPEAFHLLILFFTKRRTPYVNQTGHR